MVAAQKQGRYCAGLWWEEIRYSLCWTTGNHSSSRPNSYIAPSWSWASIMGSVIFPDTGNSIYFEAPQALDSVSIRDYQAIQRGSNQFGEIECAWLELEARLSPLFKVAFEGKRKYRNSNQREYFSFDSRSGEEFLEVVFDVIEDPVDDCYALFMMYASKKPERESWPMAHKSEGMQLSGLILRPVLDQEKAFSQYNLPKRFSLYQRVGFFTLVTRQAKEKVLEMVPVTNIVLI